MKAMVADLTGRNTCCRVTHSLTDCLAEMIVHLMTSSKGEQRPPPGLIKHSHHTLTMPGSPLAPLLSLGGARLPAICGSDFLSKPLLVLLPRASSTFTSSWSSAPAAACVVSVAPQGKVHYHFCSFIRAKFVTPGDVGIMTT